MKVPWKWEKCIVQHDADVVEFIKEFFGQKHRTVLLIAGAGFDPRATRICELLSASLDKRLGALLLREERPNPEPELCRRAEDNIQHLLAFIPEASVLP